MKLTIVGDSGRTGSHLAEQALAAGHDVVALMRNPAKLTLRHERLRVAHGELTEHRDSPQPLAARGAQRQFALLGRLFATRSMVNETVQVGEAIRGSDRDWTVVVVTAPTDEPGTGTVKVRTGTRDRADSRISRADLAQFMLAQADDPRYARQELRISN
jgi:putative NADH-flavin reductase